MSEKIKAVAINNWVTARESNSGQILLFVPSDCTESGHISPPSEIYLTREAIELLAKEFPRKKLLTKD